MAIQDTWYKRDGNRTREWGEGKRWRIRWHGYDRSFPDSGRKQVTAHDKPPRVVEAQWHKVRATDPQKKREDVTVGELLDRWLLTKRKLSKSGYRNCRIAAEESKAAWGDVLAAEVTAPAVREWVAGLGGSPSKQIKTIQALSGALAIAAEEELITKNPCADVGRPKEKPKEAHYLTEQQVGILAVAAGSFGPLIWFLATTGLRPGEASALNVGDVDVKRGRVRVRAEDVGASKSETARDAPVPRPVIDMLDLDRPRSAPLFPSPGGARLNVHNWGRRHFRDAARTAGLAGIRPYDLRHTAVSLAVSNGEHVKVIQRMVGHKPGSNLTEGRYAHLFDRDLDRAADRMAELVVRGRSVATASGDTP